MNRKSIRQSFYNLYFSFQRYNSQLEANGPVFIIGTGRSGTHFLCSCLNKFSNLDDGFYGKESKYIFDYLSKLTVQGNSLSRSVRGYYNHMMRKVSPSVLVDQTHPNIWHVEKLIEWYPNAKFLSLTRCVYSVVYSMINHQGVAAWEINHTAYPMPNRFLGINEDNEIVYRDVLTDIQRFVFRWCSHTERNHDLANLYPDKVLHIKYENLAEDMSREMNRIAAFLSVEPPISMCTFNEVSLHKKDRLSDAQVLEINNAIKLYQGEGSQSE